MSDLTPEQRQYRKVNELFWQAKELNKEHRLDFLKEVCGDNLALFNQVLTLLNEENNLGILDNSNAFGLIGLHKIAVDNFTEQKIMDLGQNIKWKDFIGKQFNDRYDIIELISKGGMGIVFLANDNLAQNQEQKKVAIKILLNVTITESDIIRFDREIKHLISLDHPNIVKIIDNGVGKLASCQDKYHFLVMEYLAGDTLKIFLEKQKPTLLLKRKLTIINQICKGLNFVHKNGITHRDIKPENIMVLADDNIKIIDFGISKNNNLKDNISRGMRIGTVPYMSPEQWRMEDVIPESDIYSLGLVIYEILSGHNPFSKSEEGQEVSWWLDAHLNKEPENHLREHCNISQEFANVVMSMLEKKANQRPVLTNVIDLINEFFLISEAITIKIEPFQFDSVEIDSNGKKVQVLTTPVKQQYREDLGDGIELEMVEIPGGTFSMGTRRNHTKKLEAEYKKYGDEIDAHKWVLTETTQHTVELQSFYIGKYQITQAQWKAIMGYSPSKYQGNDNPVENVSWEDAMEFCKKLSTKTRREYRLPSEAEWEYACRAGKESPFAFGETIISEIVNYNGNFPYGKAPKGKYRGETIPVGSLGLANGYGLYDMHGNVWEWCQDIWQDSYKNPPKDSVLSTNIYRVLRGGSYQDWAYNCRSANRDARPLYASADTIGFRVVFARTLIK